MAEVSNIELLQSIVKLTEKPDVRDFELAFVAAIDRMLPKSRSSIYRFREDGGAAPEKTVIRVSAPAAESAAQERAFPLHADPDMSECFRTERPVMAAGKTHTRAVYPLRATGKIVGFLVMEYKSRPSGSDRLISSLVGFYGNYATLLYDSQRDQLTGLRNRKTFHEKMLQIIASCRNASVGDASAAKYCVGILDLDHFKGINDRFGHLYGDEVLLLFARAMIDAFRGGDLLFRFGGEEFVALLKEVDINRAAAVFDRFRESIGKVHFPQVGNITVSAGLSMVYSDDLPSTVIDRADKALYFAKNNGRNCVCAYETLAAQGKVEVVAKRSDVELF
jgi:diguanylate cyclase (GGDEF)-like protein